MDRLFVGIDWGTETHHMCAMDEERTVKERLAFAHDRGGVERLFERIRALRPLDRAVFVLERSDGLLVDTLISRGMEVWYVNPKQSQRFRERYNPAGAKDDRRDAWVLANAARTDPELFRRVQKQPAKLLQLRAVERRHTEFGEEIKRQVSRARACLAEYYPQFLRVSSDLEYDWVRELFRLAPTPDAGRKLKLHRIKRLVSENRVRKHTPEEILALLKADELVADPAAIVAAQPLVSAQLDLIDVAVRHHRAAAREMDTLLDEIGTSGAHIPKQDVLTARGVAPPTPPSSPPDWALIATAVRSMPGVGSKIAAVLMGEAPMALQAGNYHELRALTGAAPVTDATGKRSKAKALVKMRKACNVRLRDQMHMWGATAANADPHWKAYRTRLLDRGATVARANRQVADRLLSILCALVRTASTYDPTRFSTPSSQLHASPTEPTGQSA